MLHVNPLPLALILAAPPCFMALSEVHDPSSQSLEFELLWEFLDRDGNGLVLPYEGADAFLLLSWEADGDGDGALGQAELLDYLSSANSAAIEEENEFFAGLDKDGDGTISADELPEEWRFILNEADLDDDGRLSRAEWDDAEDLGDSARAFEAELLDLHEELDQDGYGLISLADLEPLARDDSLQVFEDLDADVDGQLTLDELLGLVEEELEGIEIYIDGEAAKLTGVIGSATPGRLLQLRLEHPEVTRLVLVNVPGSIDDEANLRAGRFVRLCGWATHVPAHGEVASGGVDLFLAGAQRSADTGARFGVHSWAGFDGEGSLLDREDPGHDMYLAYYADLAISEDFYWFTLESASAEDIHWMTEEELIRFGALNTSSPAPQPEGPAHDEEAPEDGDLYCGCIQKAPTGEVPADLYGPSEVRTSGDFGPLTKALTARGVTLVAADDVSDEFLVLVGETIEEILQPGEDLDLKAQGELITKLYAYRALIPVPRSEASFEHLLRSHEESFDAVRFENSVCDIIMAEVPEGQVMEVLEHILHIVSDVGLHYQFPAEWGLNRNSELWRAMGLAIAGGFYSIEGYDELDDAPADVRDRVLMQEFAYWFISSAWDLQEDYGPHEAEWTLNDRTSLQQALPAFFEVYERTVQRVMSPPTRGTLKKIGPRRAEER